jgi:Na+/serine symporter
MPEEGGKSSLGWRMLAVGSLLLLAVGLALMSFVLLPKHAPPDAFTGVVWVALSTAAGIREYGIIVAASFVVLGGATGLGYADKLLKPIACLALVALVFFAVAVWWTIRTVPMGGFIQY